MKITCTKSDLNNALRIVSKAIANKPQTPILSGIFMKTNGEQLELQATNYELGFVSRIPADVEEPGQITLPGRYIQEVVNKLPGDNVTLFLANDAKTVNVQSGQANFDLLSMNAAEFPQIQPLVGNVQFKINDNILRQLIKKTVFACSTDEGRPVFTGCSLNISGSQVIMAATNTHRLAIMQYTFPEEVGNIKVIIPAKILLELAHNLTGTIPSPVTVTCSFNQISFQTQDFYMSSRLIEGQFPSFDNVFPKAYATQVQVEREAFAAALERVSLVARSGEYNVVKLHFAEGNIHLASRDPEVGNADDDVAAEVTGPELTIAFNVQYLTDVLRSMESEVVRIGMNKELSPTVIREANTEEFTYVVTPVRTAH